MKKKISFSDGVFLNACCRKLLDEKFDGEQRKVLIKTLEKKEKQIKEKANGYWKLPEGKIRFITIAQQIKQMLALQADPIVVADVIQQCALNDSVVEKKCKVVFFAQERSIWPSIASAYKAMSKDKRFEAQLIYVPFVHINKQAEDEVEEYHKAGLPIIPCSEYDLSDENPDVVVFAKPYEGIPPQFYIREVEKIINRTVYIPYGLEINYNLISYGFGYYLHYHVWRHIAYGDIVREIGQQYGYHNGENIAVWGHPKIDNYISDERYNIPTEWTSKIKHRKILLWCPHHTIVQGPECVSTYLNFSDLIFKEVDRHKDDLVLLWRPHPLLFGALVNNHYMTQEELEKFIEHKCSQSNIILDRHKDYRAALYISDGMISDGTTFAVEYLLTGKPLMLTTQNIHNYYLSEEMEKSLYIGSDEQSIVHFFDNFAKEEDPKKKLRENLCNKMFYRPKNKSVGQNIADNLIDAIYKEENIV